jgi:MFS family permease
MTVEAAAARGRGGGYKWIALSNTTIGMLMATINGSIVLISLPAIFRGIGVNPLGPGNVSYLLWMLLGYMVATAVLVVSLGRIGDMYGRVKLYNLGFAIFTVFAIALSLVPWQGTGAALALIILRILQAVGGAMIMANAAAIITDAFPPNERGMALGINSVAAIAGAFIGLVVGGLLSTTNWHLVFLVSVPVGVFGTVWAYLKLREVGTFRRARVDWGGNLTFGLGLVAILVGITYGIQPYGDSPMGWSNPMVLASLIAGIVLLVLFVFVESRVPQPMFNLGLFKRPAFSAGNLAGLLASIGRGGLMFILIIWLQGIWLPLHGYNYEDTPLWSAIYMLPMTAGFLIAGPVSGYLSDRFGARPFATGGMLACAASFGLMLLLPANFPYLPFGLLLLSLGLGMGLFAAPNSAGIMNSVPPDQRGVAAGMQSTFQNAGMNLSIGLFFSLIVVGLSNSLPGALWNGLTAQGVPAAAAGRIAQLPPVSTLFAAFLGYNPMQTLLGPVLGQLPAGRAAVLTSHTFFPDLIEQPFMNGMHITFTFAGAMMLVAAVASWLRGKRYVYAEPAEGSGATVAREGAAPPALAAQPSGAEATEPAGTGARPCVVTLVAAADAPARAIGKAVAERLGVPFLDLTAGPEHLADVLSSALSSDAGSTAALARLLARLTTLTTTTNGDAARLSTFQLQEEVVGLAARGGVVMLAPAGVSVPRPDPAGLQVRLDAPWGRRLAPVAGATDNGGNGGPPRCHLAIDVSRVPVAACIEAIAATAQAGRDGIPPAIDAAHTSTLPELVEIPRRAEPEAPAQPETRAPFAPEPQGPPSSSEGAAAGQRRAQAQAQTQGQVRADSTELLTRLAQALTAELRRQQSGPDGGRG